jgi:hypothetical protein
VGGIFSEHRSTPYAGLLCLSFLACKEVFDLPLKNHAGFFNYFEVFAVESYIDQV